MTGDDCDHGALTWVALYEPWAFPGITPHYGLSTICHGPNGDFPPDLEVPLPLHRKVGSQGYPYELVGANTRSPPITVVIHLCKLLASPTHAMPPVYITDTSKGNISISAFEDRGIKNGSPTTVTDSGIVIFPSTTVPLSFSSIVARLHMYGSQTLFPGPVTTENVAINLLKNLNSIPVNPPVVMVNVKGMESRDDLKELGMREDVGIKFPGNFMISSKFSYDNLRKIWNTGIDVFGPAAAGNTNPAGLLAFYYGWKAVALYCLVVGNRKSMVPEVTYINARDSVASVEDGVQAIGSDATGVRRKIQDANEKTGKMYLDSSESLLEVFAPIETEVKVEQWWTECTETIKQSGFIFPFFDEMLLPEKYSSFRTFAQHFSRCIGDNMMQVGTLLPTLRQGFRALANSVQGRELQHVLYGVQTSIDTGSKFRVIVNNGKYKGFVILNPEVKMIRGGNMWDADSATDLTTELRRLDVHRNNVNRIVELISPLELRLGGGTELLDTTQARTNARYLANEIHRRVWKGTMVEDELKMKVGELQYGQTYWPIDDEHVALALDALASNQIDISAPFYSGGETFFSDDPYVRILAVFGANAPTLSVRTGDYVIMIPPVNSAEDGNKKLVDGKRKLPYLPIYSRGLQDAADMWRSVNRTHTIRAIGAKKAQKTGKLFDRSKDVGVVSGTRFETLYERLKVFAYKDLEGKRARDEGEDDQNGEERRVAKKAKVAAISSIADFM